MNEPQLRIVETAVEDGTARARRSGERTLFRVELAIAGRALAMLKSVTWHLHPTFRNPRREVRRTLANPDCRLVIWVWGTFEVRAECTLADGSTRTLSHDLDFPSRIREAKAAVRMEK